MIFSKISKTINFKTSVLQKKFKNKPFKLLDVGAGNHSAIKITSMFPQCDYYGLDIEKGYNNSEADFARMKEFYEIDLTKLNYSIIPDNFFDGILMTHVIEHLFNGDEVLTALIKKINKNGIFYLEYPSKRSAKLPSMRGTLNFYDDPTHVRIYSIEELTPIILENNCQIISSGTRRNWFYIILLPCRLIYSLLKKGHIEGNVFWDLLGFAEFIYFKKNS